MANDYKPSFFFVATLMNFVLATGVFTLPFSMYESGIILGSIVLTITCGLSIIACTFIIEALATQNCFIKDEKAVLTKASVEYRNSTSSGNAFTNVFSAKVMDDEGKSYPPSSIEVGNSNNNNLTEVMMKEAEEEDQFYIFKRLEISKLASRVFNKPVYYFVVISMICYLYIGLTSNAMIAGKSLLSIISKTVGGSGLSYDYYYAIVLIFFFFVILLALNNINHLKKLSMLIMICRFIMIFLILGSCIYAIVNYGSAKFSDIPKFNMPNITVMIGNSLFLFMSHHSMPGMVENFKPQKNLIRLVVIAYIFSLIIMLTYGYVSLFAFAHFTNCDTGDFPCAIQSTFSLNFLSLPVIGYIINYYPLLNIITSALLAITLKNNVLQVIGSCSLDMYKTLDFSQQSGFFPLLCSFVFNIFLVMPSVMAAIFLPDIQQLMKYFSSVFGFIIMIIIPSILVYAYRMKFAKTNLTKGKLNRAFLTRNWQLVTIGAFGVCLFSMIVYGFIKGNNKTCVAQVIQ